MERGGNATVRIALIDDDSDFSALVEELLDEQGWTVVTCNDDGSALQCVREESPNLVILDVRMSTRESGWNILEQILAEPAISSIPVIVCTAALDDLNARSAWLKEHDVASLSKPFDLDDLLSLIERLLSGDSGTGQSAGAPSNGGKLPN